jgi:hypothetical protein
MRNELDAFARWQKLVLGDRAILTVMEVLFEERAEPWLGRAASELAPPIDAIPQPHEDHETVPITAPPAVTPVRSFQRRRAAVEVATALDENFDVPTTPVDQRRLADDVSTQPLGVAVDSPPATYPRGTARQSVVAPLPASRWRRWRWFALGGSTALLIAIVYIIQATGTSSRTPKPVRARCRHRPGRSSRRSRSSKRRHPPRRRRFASTSTTPDDATILLDGQWLGHTPYDGRALAAAGSHTLKIRRRVLACRKLEVKRPPTSRDVVLDRSRRRALAARLRTTRGWADSRPRRSRRRRRPMRQDGSRRARRPRRAAHRARRRGAGASGCGWRQAVAGRRGASAGSSGKWRARPPRTALRGPGPST